MKILFVVALGAEIEGIDFKEHAVRITGVGKINATVGVLAGIKVYRPDLIVNLGTAGSGEFPYGSVVECVSFIQRDMNATAFGYEKYQTPGEDKIEILSSSHFKKLTEHTGICGSGDSFETASLKSVPYNVVDMEAYAIAKVCDTWNIPFRCFKFISDGADSNAPKSWKESLELCRSSLSEIVCRLV